MLISFKLSLTIIFICFLFNSLKSQSLENKVVQLGSHREIFVDSYLIDSLKNTRLIMHVPHDDGVVMTFDKPWEGIFCGYTTIIKDNSTYRAYYRGNPGGKDGSNSEVTCIIESKDGVHWIKPNIGIYKMNGTFNNNIILANEAPSSHNFTPFIDKNPNVKPNQKYKALALGSGGLVAYFSSDGIHWKKMQDKAVITKGAFDSQNIAIWSEVEGRYVCYLRTWTGGDFKGIRTVSRVSSPDFINWSEPEQMTFGSTPMENLYTQQTSPYFRAPQIYLAIGARFMPNREVVSEKEAKRLNVDPGYFKDCSDVILMSTRGGNSYDRTFMESFIRPGIGLKNWVSRTNYPALNVVETGPEEISIYVNEDYAQPSSRLNRYSLRIDGFTSINAPYNGGEVFTKPFKFSGKELEINYSTSAPGEIRVEIQDENGKPIPGFTIKDGQAIIGNETKRIVSWNGDENVSKLAGKLVRLHIYMKDADLYSLKFNE